MYVFLYAKLTLYIKVTRWLQTSAVPAVNVHHFKVTILPSFFVPSEHIQTLCGSLRIFCECGTKPFKNMCSLSTGHFVNKIVSSQPLIQYEQAFWSLYFPILSTSAAFVFKGLLNNLRHHVINPRVMRYLVWIGFYFIWSQSLRIFFFYLLINLFLWKLHRTLSPYAPNALVWKIKNTPNSSEISPLLMWIILSSSTSNDENVKPNNKFFRKALENHKVWGKVLLKTRTGK